MATDAPPDDRAKNELEFVRNWLEAIELSGENGEEKDWFKTADRSCDTYRGGQSRQYLDDLNLNTFNIFHSNVETMVPAIYNSTPIPDVRRRFNDPDPVAKDVCELLERALSYQVDAYDFDQTILTAVRDMAIVSRGVARVRYVPTIANGQKQYETVVCEYFPWRRFRRGPGKTWEEIPWIAFELFPSYGEVEKLVADEKDKAKILKDLKFSYSAEPKKDAEQQADNRSRIAARARVWEIWDKDNKQVHFISPDYTSARLTTLDDPLEVQDFWPIPRPLSAISAPDSLVPIAPLQIYEQLLEELNITQRRIMRLTQQMRVRGWYAGLNAEDIRQAAEADDGELIALTGAETFVTQGTGLDKAISYWPIETIAGALKQLVEQRELIKMTIYEVTGISDIVRGASNAQETATAQQIKTQWGSLRIQRMQQEVARFVRDLFRLKAEIMANKFDFSTFEMMSGLKFPTEQEKQQAQQMLQLAEQTQQQPDPQLQEIIAKPTREQIEQLIRNDALRGFRVDIESDSTIRGDLQKSQEQMSLFMQGTAQYLDAVSRAQGQIPPDLAIEIYAGFARSFRLGKQAEDALDRLADQAKNMANQPKPPSPEEIKMQLEQQKMQGEMQKMQMELELKKAELQLKERELQGKMALEQKKAEQDFMIEQMQAQQKMQIAQAEAEQKAQLAQIEAEQKRVIDEENARIKMMHDREAMRMKIEQQNFDHQRKAKESEIAFGNEEARRDVIAKAKAQAELKSVARLSAKREKDYDDERKSRAGKPIKGRILKRGEDGRGVEFEIH